MIGIIVSVFQAATQIHEQNIVFVPKIIATSLILVVLGSWIISLMINFTQNVFTFLNSLRFDVGKRLGFMWDNLFDNYIVFLLLFVRMMGMIVFNPLLGRRDVPVIIKMGLSFFLALVLMGVNPNPDAIVVDHMLAFILLCVKELAIGFLVGFMMQMFFAALQAAGEFMDLQLGVGMAKVYDPYTNVSMSLTGNMLNIFYTVIFFVSNGHLTLIKVIASSLAIIPLGTLSLNPDCGQFVALFFSNILILAVKLALPIVAIEIVSELGLGILMRTVPQINVFVVGLQLKLLVGLIMIILVFPGFFDFFDSMTTTMFDSIFSGLKSMV